MYEQENHDDIRRIDQQLTLSVPYGHGVKNRSFIKSMKPSHTNEGLEDKSFDDSDQSFSQTSVVNFMYS